MRRHQGGPSPNIINRKLSHKIRKSYVCLSSALTLIPNPIAIGIPLITIGNRGTVIAGVSDSIAIAICQTLSRRIRELLDERLDLGTAPNDDD